MNAEQRMRSRGALPAVARALQMRLLRCQAEELAAMVRTTDYRSIDSTIPPRGAITSMSVRVQRYRAPAWMRH